MTGQCYSFASPNAAGRAVAAGLTPTGAGPLQISASAAFQGQTAAITIAQTNVATAAQAAAASAAGGGGAGTSGAAGGAGAGAAGGAASGAGAAVGGSTAATGAATAGAATTGGISATTLGIVGAAVAGGALAATKIVGASSDGTKYSGSYSGQFTSVVAQKNGTPSCTIGQTNTGTLTLNVVEQNGSVTGGAELQDVRTGLPGTCGGVPPSGPYFTGTIGTPLSGSLSNPTFNWTETSLVQPNNNTVTHTYSFVGSLSGGVITGTLSYSFRADDPTSIGTGSVQMPVTLR